MRPCGIVFTEAAESGKKKEEIPMKKLSALILALVLCLSLVPAMAEGEGNRYVSTQNVTFMSAYPQYTFKMATFGIQYLELVDETTYRLIAVENSFSGALLFSDDGTYDVVPRGGDVRIYTGTYEAFSDSGLLFCTLHAPETLTVTSTNSIAAASASFTGEAAAEPTMEELLAQYGFEDVELMIDEETGVFDYIVVGPQA